jgi:hypothetical protein
MAAKKEAAYDEGRLLAFAGCAVSMISVKR